MIELKEYLTPELSVTSIDTRDIMTLSRQDGDADDVSAGWEEDAE